MTNQTTPYSRWYKRHGTRINAERRKLRKTDAEFGAKLRAYGYNYFEQNKDTINAQRRHRLETDAEFRERIRQQHEAWREGVRDGRIVPSWPALYQQVGGKQQRVYRQSEVARMIGCSPAAIIKWTRQGWIPAATYKTKTRKVYTLWQLDLLRSFVLQDPFDHNARSKASERIFALWTQ